MTVRTIVLDEMYRVAREQKKMLRPLSDNAPLLTVGLDSLCFAILVSRLEETLGIDPFGREDITLPVTVGELITFYEKDLVGKQST